MRTFIEFLKTTIMGGLFVLLPVLLFYLLLTEALQAIVGLATPIADLFPKDTFDESKALALVALLLLVGTSFLIGLAMRSTAGRRLGSWVESATLGKLPGYNAIKQLIAGFTRTGSSFQPALLSSPDGAQELAYVVEDYADGRITVLVPWAPTPFAGSVKLVKRERVELLDTGLGEFTKVLSHWGVGARDLLGKNTSGGDLSEDTLNSRKG
jgi:uncharacterized membrane protein